MDAVSHPSSCGLKDPTYSQPKGQRKACALGERNEILCSHSSRLFSAVVI
jgi:hypothetical protein